MTEVQTYIMSTVMSTACCMCSSTYRIAGKLLSKLVIHALNTIFAVVLIAAVINRIVGN